MEELVFALARSGGPVVICLAVAYLYIRQLARDLRDTQNKRVEDNQAMVTKLLELNDKWSETINSQAELIESQRQILSDLRQFMFDDKRPHRR